MLCIDLVVVVRVVEQQKCGDGVFPRPRRRPSKTTGYDGAPGPSTSSRRRLGWVIAVCATFPIGLFHRVYDASSCLLRYSSLRPAVI